EVGRRSLFELDQGDLMVTDGIEPVVGFGGGEVVDIHRGFDLGERFLTCGVGEEEEAIRVSAGTEEPMPVGVKLEPFDHAASFARPAAAPLALAQIEALDPGFVVEMIDLPDLPDPADGEMGPIG